MAGDQVFLIDDNEAVRDALALYLQSKSLNVRPFESAVSFLHALDRNSNGGCIVSDVRMPNMSGLELQKALKARDVRIPLILISGHGDIDMAVRAVKEGAHDFIEKPFPEQRLLSAIESAMRSSERMRDDTQLLQRLRELHKTLTDREREVMNFAVEGYTNKQIALRLGISIRTVEIYRAKAMEKMEAPSFAAFVRMALKLSES